jgi:hypothetical protein
MSANVSVRVPGTPFAIGGGTNDGETLSQVNAGIGMGRFVNLSLYASVGQGYSCGIR